MRNIINKSKPYWCSIIDRWHGSGINVEWLCHELNTPEDCCKIFQYWNRSCVSHLDLCAYFQDWCSQIPGLWRLRGQGPEILRGDISHELSGSTIVLIQPTYLLRNNTHNPRLIRTGAPFVGKTVNFQVAHTQRDIDAVSTSNNDMPRGTFEHNIRPPSRAPRSSPFALAPHPLSCSSLTTSRCPIIYSHAHL